MYTLQRHVDTVILHLHLDELGALYVLMQSGTDTFIMTRDLQLDFWSRPERRDPGYWAAQRTLVIGGSGDILDEHVDGDRNCSRLAGQSAVNLALGLCKVSDPHLRSMVAEITKFDNEAGCPVTHLATILKIVGTHEKRPGKLEAMGSMVLQIMSAIHCNLAYKFDKPTTSFLEYVLGIVDTSPQWNDEDARGALIMMVEKESRPDNATLFGLCNVYESLCSVTAAYPGHLAGCEVRAVITYLLEMLYLGQVNFHTLKRSVLAMKPERFLVEVMNDQGGFVRIPVMTLNSTSDNPAAHSVLRAERALLSIVRNASGNISIQGDQCRIRDRKIIAPIDRGIEALTAMCRFRELPLGRQKYANWDSLRRYGECSFGAPWYLDDKGRCALYNGTYTHPAPPTRLSLCDMGAMVKIAFVPDWVRQWKVDRGVREGSCYSYT